MGNWLKLLTSVRIALRAALKKINRTWAKVNILVSILNLLKLRKWKERKPNISNSDTDNEMSRIPSISLDIMGAEIAADSFRDENLWVGRLLV